MRRVLVCYRAGGLGKPHPARAEPPTRAVTRPPATRWTGNSTGPITAMSPPTPAARIRLSGPPTSLTARLRTRTARLSTTLEDGTTWNSLAELLGTGFNTSSATFELWFKAANPAGKQILFETGGATTDCRCGWTPPTSNLQSATAAMRIPTNAMPWFRPH